jgi:hypothetical protein
MSENKELTRQSQERIAELEKVIDVLANWHLNLLQFTGINKIAAETVTVEGIIANATAKAKEQS